MFGLDIPSTIQFQMPDWRGDIRVIGGWAQDRAGAVYDAAKAYIDPLEKSAKNVQSEASGYIQRAAGQAQSGFFGAIASIFEAKNDLVESAASGIGQTFAPVTSGLKWGIALVVVGVAIYFFLLAAPFLPKPKGA